MQKSVESTQRMFNTIRTGRANSSLLDRITVEYYGAETPLKSLATLTTPDSQTIQIQPFDISALAGIEKAIVEKAIAMSELGFTPNNDGKIIRINVPPLTEERRKEFCKLASKYAEEGKVALRNIRRDAIDRIKKQEKEGDFSAPTTMARSSASMSPRLRRSDARSSASSPPNTPRKARWLCATFAATPSTGSRNRRRKATSPRIRAVTNRRASRKLSTSSSDFWRSTWPTRRPTSSRCD